MAVYGYLNRTSINDCDDRDIASMFRTVPGERIVIEQTWSRGDMSRPAFDRLLDSLSHGDVLYISSIDRLGLDAEDSVRLWYLITKEKNTDIIVLNDKKLNSRDEKVTKEQLITSADTAFRRLNKKLLSKKHS